VPLVAISHRMARLVIIGADDGKYISEQRSFCLEKTVKFLLHKNIFTHSFISIDDYSMIEVTNEGLGKNIQ
jgi:hypothetical protein